MPITLTTLDRALDDSDEEVVLNAVIPSTTRLVRIGNEVLKVLSYNGEGDYTMERGFANSKSAAHSDESPVLQLSSAIVNADGTAVTYLDGDPANNVFEVIPNADVGSISQQLGQGGAQADSPSVVSAIAGSTYPVGVLVSLITVDDVLVAAALEGTYHGATISEAEGDEDIDVCTNGVVRVLLTDGSEAVDAGVGLVPDPDNVGLAIAGENGGLVALEDATPAQDAVAATAIDTINKIVFTSKQVGAAGNSSGPNIGVEVYAGSTGQPVRYEVLSVGDGLNTSTANIHIDCDTEVHTVGDVIDYINGLGAGSGFTAALGDGGVLDDAIVNSPVTLNTVYPFEDGADATEAVNNPVRALLTAPLY